jgi:hypothetical protein
VKRPFRKRKTMGVTVAGVVRLAVAQLWLEMVDEGDTGHILISCKIIMRVKEASRTHGQGK